MPTAMPSSSSGRSTSGPMARIRTERRGGGHAMLRILLVLSALAAPLSAFAAAGKPVNVVTTTEDLAAIAREVGGDRVTVASLSRGYQDPHFVDAKPSYLVQLKKADLFVEVGRELEV